MPGISRQACLGRLSLRPDGSPRALGRRAGQPSPRTSEGPRRFQTNRTQPPTVCGTSAVVMELAGAGMVSESVPILVGN